jgi:N-acetylglucosamine-6-sulfatase
MLISRGALPRLLLGLVVPLGFAACGGVSGGGDAAPAAATAAATPSPPAVRPSIVLILTDDLDVPTTEALPRLGGLFAQEGLTFDHAYVTQPLCAPSRASILTGRYSHNHGVHSNTAPDGGFSALRPSEASTIAVWLKSAGYRTGLVGKYINDYPTGGANDHVPPGWDYWYGHCSGFEDDRYYSYYVNDNGALVKHGAKPEDYSTDLEAQRAVEFIRRAAAGTEPFFLYLAPEAPHAPAYYAERHGGEFTRALAPRVPSFNEADVRDKPVWVWGIDPMSDEEIDRTDRLQQWRLRSMLAVEDMIQGVVQALAETGRLDRTYIIFTSDNGILMGQHRIVGRKGSAYEESIRVPLMVRGPGVPKGVADLFALNIDLAPTLAELAGVSVPGSVDGRSLAPILRGSPPAADRWRADVLVENYGTGISLTLRTRDWMFQDLESGEVELYDMRKDPYQLESLHRQADPTMLEGFRRRIGALSKCQGASCRE